jgi:Ni/Co efflux regulator RcnB
MNSKAAISAIVAMTLVCSGSVFGQGNGGHDERGDDRGRNEEPERGGAQDRRGEPAVELRDGPGRPDDRARFDRDPRGAAPTPSWQRGDRLPPEYRAPQYVVEDWRGHHLSAPPRGYHWVQNGGDYLLVAVTTGVILQMLMSR